MLLEIGLKLEKSIRLVPINPSFICHDYEGYSMFINLLNMNAQEPDNNY